MMTLKERAKSYAEQVKPNDPLACEFDYLAGAREEHILLEERAIDWLAFAVCEGIVETDNLSSAITSLKEALNNEQD